jgi:hypothetical protein
LLVLVYLGVHEGKGCRVHTHGDTLAGRMTRSARSQAAKGQPEGNGGSSESDGTNSEKQEQPECLLKVKKLMGMYSTPVRYAGAGWGRRCICLIEKLFR